MLFALADYWRYKRRRGAYSRELSESYMGATFEKRLSVQATQLLQPGDVIFVQTLDWPFAWLVMYLTAFPISHVASYVGDGEICHSTLDGVRIEAIDALYASNVRLLPCLWPMRDDQRVAVAEMMRRDFSGRPYSWRAVALKGLLIASGRHWPAFRWRLFADLTLCLALLDAPLVLALGFPVLTWLAIVHLGVVALHGLTWPLRPLKLTELTGTPADLFTMLRASGGQFMYDAMEVRAQAERLRAKAQASNLATDSRDNDIVR